MILYSSMIVSRVIAYQVLVWYYLSRTITVVL